MECPYCNAKNRDDVRYCSNCGKLIGVNSISLPLHDQRISRALSPGARLQGGRYVVQRVLGQGGMGAALLALDIRLDNKPVVIKELISDYVDSSRQLEDVRNFKREVSTLAHIDHPLVPNVTDHFQEGTRYFMVQECIEGENLEERLLRTGQPMPERDALICASEVLAILDYLAQQTPPIVHRDIKPANIIISNKDKRAHLVDFGIARADAARKQTTALGTPGYAPPEQYQGNADPRSDLYALAGTLHHVLTNRDPRNHPPFNYPPVRALNAQLSLNLEHLLARALQNDPNLRYQSAIAMKQDVDSILHERFGLSGNIDSYIVGTSFSLHAIRDVSATDPRVPVPSTLAVSSLPLSSSQSAVTPLQPLLSASRLPANSIPVSPAVRPVHRSRKIGSVGLFLIVLIVIMLLFGTYFVFSNHVQNVNSPKTITTPISTVPPSLPAIGVAQIGNDHIGISDGSFAFDTNLPDAALKSQAALSLLHNSNDINRAVSLLNEAVSQSSNDAESLIYLEDLRVLNSGSPYITLVVATMLSGDAETVGRDDLQGAYVAQREFNSAAKLPGGLQIRLLVASSGSKTDYVQRVAQQIVQLSHTDKTFVGVMGWPYSSRSLAAIKILADAHIPLVSQTSSSDLLTRASPYFFRVVPSNNVQGIAAAKYAEQTLHVSKAALFYDPADSYSQSLAQDFSRQFTADNNAVVVTEKYTVGQPASLPALLRAALSKNPDFLYFSGYSSDLSTLLTNLPPASNIPVVGGDALYELGGYPASAVAGFTHLRFTAFAYPDEWGILGYGDQQPAFFAEYASDFNSNGLHSGSPYGFTRADNDAILSYDATLTLLTGCTFVYNSGQHAISPQNLQLALQQLHGTNTIQGVSGQIALGSDGDPVNKAIVVLSVDNSGHIHMEPLTLGRFLK